MYMYRGKRWEDLILISQWDLEMDCEILLKIEFEVQEVLLDPEQKKSKYFWL